MDEARGALVAATGDPEFWRCYAFDGNDYEFDFEAAGEGLARRLNGVDVDAEDWSEEDDDDLVSAMVILPVRRGWWLSLSMSFELTLHVLCLNTDEDEEDDEEDDEEYEPEQSEYEDDDRRSPDSSLELGHWDQARWRPFCLRWSEVEAVVAQMRAEPDLHPLPPEVGMLLLARWVGHGADEAALLDERREVIAGTFERLGLFHGEDAVRMAAQLLQAMPDDDYAWRWDSERGWLLSGANPGYSKRNECYDSFPFAEVTEFRRQLGVADGPDGQS